MLSLVQAARYSTQLSAHARQLHFRTYFSLPVSSAGSYNGVLKQPTTCLGSSSPTTSQPFLAPSSVLTTQSAGIKHVGELSLRCRHCYFSVKDEQKFVMCTAKPRHYQAQKQPGKK